MAHGCRVMRAARSIVIITLNKGPYRDSNEALMKYNLAELKHPPVSLDAASRSAVGAAIREVCENRNWALLALNVRTNHAHTVARIGGATGSAALNSFKAYATRKMRELGCWKFDRTPWASRGSKRKLWNEQSIEKAIDYVTNGQGDDLPNFD